jgi:hypothetical protein
MNATNVGNPASAVRVQSASMIFMNIGAPRAAPCGLRVKHYVLRCLDVNKDVQRLLRSAFVVGTIDIVETSTDEF